MASAMVKRFRIMQSNVPSISRVYIRDLTFLPLPSSGRQRCKCKQTHRFRCMPQNTMFPFYQNISNHTHFLHTVCGSTHKVSHVVRNALNKYNSGAGRLEGLGLGTLRSSISLSSVSPFSLHRCSFSSFLTDKLSLQIKERTRDHINYPLCGLSTYKTKPKAKIEDLQTTHDGKSLVDRFLYVKTLENYFDDIPGGVVFDTAYADSRPNEDFEKSLPVIVGLHDTPGDHRDLVPVLDFFSKLGCRAICPTLPGHGQTRGVMRGHDDIFTQSTLERANFVNDFLNNLDVGRVDLLIGVGASCYTAMALCTHGPEVYKSTALISPWPVSKLRFNVNPEHLRRITESWDLMFVRPALRVFLRSYQIGAAKSTLEKITSAYLLSNIDFGEVYSQTMALSMKKIPYVVAYGGQDLETSYDEILAKLEISPDAVTKFDNVLKNLNVPGALELPSSDSEILVQQKGVICAYLLNLLQKLHPHIKF